MSYQTYVKATLKQYTLHLTQNSHKIVALVEFHSEINKVGPIRKRKQQACSEGCTCTHCLNLPHSCDHADVVTMTDEIEIEDDMRDIFGPLYDYDTDSETESESNSDEFD